LLHANLKIHDRDDRSEFLVRPKKLMLRRLFAYGDGDDAGGTGALHAGKVASQRAEFFLFVVELLDSACGMLAV
jgi:hypothetical protein